MARAHAFRSNRDAADWKGFRGDTELSKYAYSTSTVLQC